MFAGVLAFDAIFASLPEWGVRSFPQSMTLPLVLEVAYGPLVITFGVLMLLIIALADRLDPGRRREVGAVHGPRWRREWGWRSTGVLAGLIILAASAQGQYLGISGGVAALAAYIADGLGHPLDSVPALTETTAWRAAMVAGLIPGAMASAALSRSFRNVPVTPLWADAFPSGMTSRAVAVFAGGFLILLGALIGGGCTTGAFMAGFPTLSVGSIAMGMTFFATGMATAFLLYWGRWGRVSEIRGKGLNLAND